MDKYKTNRLIWLQEICRYKQKLETMLNITELRLELKEYISRHGEPSDVSHLITELQSDNFIPLIKNDVHNHRKDKKRMFYWIAKFRDHRTDEIIKKRTEKPLLPSIFYPEQILAKIPGLRYKFVQQGIKYFMLKINFNVSEIEDRIEFRYPGIDKWYYRKRIDGPQGPRCI